MAVNNKAPANVLNMVKDISGQLKSVFKTLNWQESQKRSLVQHREEMLHKMEKHNARLDENLARVEEELQVRRAHLKKMEDREALLKAELNTLTRGNGGDGRGDRNYQGRVGGIVVTTGIEPSSYISNALVSAMYGRSSELGLYLWGNPPLPTVQEHPPLVSSGWLPPGG